jgi:CRP-like cAMP-binding protein
MRKIYRILQGSCRVEMWGNDCKFLLGKLKQGSLFGEITFLFGGAVVAIVVDEADSCIASLDKSELQSTFTKKPELAGKFYKVPSAYRSGISLFN